jgi:glycosyltransferase involved in cell wall biosynthesis
MHRILEKSLSGPLLGSVLVHIAVITVAPTGIGGMQQHTRDLVAGLAQRGHDVEVIGAGAPGSVPPVDERGVRWHLLDVPTRYPRLKIQHPAWRHASRRAFLQLHGQRSFDVVHSESVGAMGLLQASLHRHIPIVVMIHGNFLGLVKQSFRRAVIARRPVSAVREAKYVITQTSDWLFSGGEPYRLRPCEVIVPSHQQIRDTVHSHLLEESRVHVVPNGVDTNLWRSRPRHPGNRPLLVAGGRMYRNKAFDVAIKAVAGVDGDLVLTGDGEEREALEQLARREGVADRVRFVGRLPLSELAELVASCDAYLFPTLEYEASGLVLLEAMSSGVPVVAARQGATAEAIDRPGENGVLVPPGDAVALADALRPLLADPGARARIGGAARQRILAENTIDLMVDRTLRVYEVARRRISETQRAPS